MNKKTTLFLFFFLFLIVSTSVVSAACVDLDDSGTWGSAVTESVSGNGYDVVESISLCQNDYTYNSLNDYYGVLNVRASDVHVDLNGSTISGDIGTTTSGVRVYPGYTNVSVSNGGFLNSYHGFLIESPTTITNCSFYNNREGGKVSSGDGSVFNNNYFYNNNLRVLDVNSDDHYFYNNTFEEYSSATGDSVFVYSGENITFEQNNFIDGVRGLVFSDGDCFNNTVNNNYFYNISQEAVVLSTGANNTFSNNDFVDNLRGISSYSSADLTIVNNSFTGTLNDPISSTLGTRLNISDNDIRDNHNGINLRQVTNSFIIGNTIIGSENRGLYLDYDSLNNYVADNILCGNQIDFQIIDSSTFTDGGNNKADIINDGGTVSTYSFDSCDGVCLPKPSCYGVFGSSLAGTTGYTISYSPANINGTEYDRDVALLYIDGGLELEHITTNNYSVTPGVIDGTHDWYVLVLNEPGMVDYSTLYARDDSGLTTCAAAAGMGITGCYWDSPTPVFEANGDGTFTVNDVYNISATGYDPVILYYGPQVNPLTGYSLNDGVSCYADSSCSTTETFPEYTIGGGEEPGDDNETEVVHGSFVVYGGFEDSFIVMSDGLSFEGNAFEQEVVSPSTPSSTGGASGTVDGPLFTKYFCNLSFSIDEFRLSDNFSSQDFVLTNNEAFDLHNVVFNYDSMLLEDSSGLFVVRPSGADVLVNSSRDYSLGLSSFVDLPFKDSGVLLVSSDECYPVSINLFTDITTEDALDLNIVERLVRGVDEDVSINDFTFKGYWLLIIFMVLIGVFSYELVYEGSFWNVVLYFLLVFVGGFLLFFLAKNIINILL